MLLISFVAICVFTAVISVVFGVFVFKKGRSNVSKIWLLMSLSVAFWSVGLGMMVTASSESEATFYLQYIHYLGAIFIPAFYLHFVLLLLGLENDKKNLIRYTYAFSIIMQFCNFSRCFASVRPNVLVFKYYTQPKIAYFPYTVVFFAVVMYTLYIIYRIYLKSLGSKRNQLKYQLFATIVGFGGGGTAFFPVFNIHIFPFGMYFMFSYMVIMSYAITRHQLMDIEVIIKKTLVFASLFTIAFGVIVGITLLTQELIAGGRLLGLAIGSLVIILSVRPVEDFLKKVTDKYLFQKKYDYTHIVNEFMDDLRTMALNTTDIAQSTVKFLETSIRPARAAILVYNKFKNRYEPIASHGVKEIALTFTNDTPLIRELSETAKIIKPSEGKDASQKENKYLNEIGFKLVLPLSIHKELLGILLLGQKKSDEEYTEEEIEALAGLSGTLSIALNNAQLFGERADAEKRALVGTLATGINHEIGNPLNIMRIKFDSFRILKKEGFYKNKTKEELIGVIENIADACTESIERIGGIARQIAEFAKPDKSLVFDKVNVRESAESILAVLKHGMIEGADKIGIKVIPETLYVIVDRGQFEQVLFNLFKNACSAISKENGRIAMEAVQSGKDEVQISVSDNGRGIPEDVKDKVFMPFFTTKEPGKGTGLGLTLTKIMVEKNDGRITVESDEGKGTTFIIILKGGA